MKDIFMWEYQLEHPRKVELLQSNSLGKVCVAIKHFVMLWCVQSLKNSPHSSHHNPACMANHKTVNYSLISSVSLYIIEDKTVVCFLCSNRAN